MILDSSAIVTIFLKAPGHDLVRHKIVEAQVIERRRGDSGGDGDCFVGAIEPGYARQPGSASSRRIKLSRSRLRKATIVLR